MVFKFDPNSSVNEGRWRLRDPDTFVNDKYIRRNFSTGIGYVLGKLKSDPEGKFVVQAIRFKKSIWTEKKAAEWWKLNKRKYTKLWKESDWKKIPLEKPTVKEAISKAKRIAKLLNIPYLSPSRVTVDTAYIKNVAIPAGSVRRNFKDKDYRVKDIDLVITKPITKLEVSKIDVFNQITGGEKRIDFVYQNVGVNLFIFLDKDTWGAALVHATGSRSYGQRLRAKVLSEKWKVKDDMGGGWKLSQYGLTKNGEVYLSRTERELQESLGVRVRKPEER